MGTQWGYRFGDTYKPARAMVKMLIQVVSHGGNLALNVGPQPNGELPPEALRELTGLGSWLKANGEAIYGTRSREIAYANGFYFTQKQTEGLVYALLPLEADESPSTLHIPFTSPVRTVTAVDTGEELPFAQAPSGITVTLPVPARGEDTPALALRLHIQN